MTSEMIEKFVETKERKSAAVNIHFKERSALKGIFIRTADYDELKQKNFWRIVNSAKIDEWKRTQDMDIPKIFNGLSFTKLTEAD